MEKHFAIIKKTRLNFLNLVNGLSLESLNKIPAGFSNNIAWNFSHITASQQVLCYQLSGVEPRVSEEYISRYTKGTKPEGPITNAQLEEIQAITLSSVDQLQKDYQAGLFKTYKEYTTSAGVILSTTEDAILYVGFHDSLHYGYAMAMRKLV